MIRTVPIPMTGDRTRAGCAPGGDCCSECSGHLGDLYDDAGVDPSYAGTQYDASPGSIVMTGPNITPAQLAAAAVAGNTPAPAGNNTVLWMVGAGAALLLFGGRS